LQILHFCCSLRRLIKRHKTPLHRQLHAQIKETISCLISFEESPLQELQDELDRAPIVVGLHLRHPLVENKAHLTPSTWRLINVLAFGNRYHIAVLKDLALICSTHHWRWRLLPSKIPRAIEQTHQAIALFSA